MDAQHAISYETGTKELLCSIREGVAILTLNRPKARNSLSDELTPALRKAIAALGDDPDIGALILTGAGEAFCSGGNVKEMGSGNSGELTAEARVARLFQRQESLTGALVGLRKPTIAALPGPAAGAGLSIALACDLRIAAASAFVTTGYSKMGLTGDYGITWLLNRLVGPSRARQLMFLSEQIPAGPCERLGLVNWVVPDEQLQQRAFEIARELAAGPARALGAIKDNIDFAHKADLLQSLQREAENMVRAAATPEHAEAVRAFVEKRKPVFRRGPPIRD